MPGRPFATTLRGVGRRAREAPRWGALARAIEAAWLTWYLSRVVELYAGRPSRPVGPFAGLFGAPLLVALGAAAAFAVFQRPEPIEGIAPDRFSTARALHALDWLTDEPRPAGSEAHDRVRLQLLAELRAAGFSPEIQASEREGVPLANVLVRLRGEKSTGVALFVCHYDSRASTPGASDDGAAVVAFLQVLELLPRRGALRNDVVFLFTDGEENGLLGARLFVENHPWAGEVAAVLNFESIGNDGPLVLFQVGPGSRGLLDLYAEHAPHPAASSLAPSVYERLPNDTDFTVFLRRGLAGLNFALVGGGEAYHSRTDTAERIDRGSVQLLGETVLALALAVGDADLGSLRREEATFFDVLGRRLVRYGRTWTLALDYGLFAWLALAFLAHAWGHGLRPRQIVVGVLLQILGVLGTALFLRVAFHGIEWGIPRLVPLLSLNPPPRAPSNLASSSWTLAGLAVLAGAAMASWMEILRPREGTVEAAAGGGFVLWAAALLWLVSSDIHAGAQLVPAVIVASSPLLLGRKRNALICWSTSALALALVSPVLALTFHLLTTNVAFAVFVAAFALPFLLLLAGPTSASIPHGPVVRFLLFAAGAFALGMGSWLRIGEA